MLASQNYATHQEDLASLLALFFIFFSNLFWQFLSSMVCEYSLIINARFELELQPDGSKEAKER